MKTILIIEDDKVTQFLLNNAFQNQGYNTKSIHDGRDLIKNESLIQGDLIILDIMMPNIYDSSQLVALYEKISIPIIVISSMEKEDGIYFTKKIGGESFFSKPLDPNILVNEVNDVFRNIEVQWT